MKPSRTQFAIGAAAAYATLGIGARPAGAAEFSLKLANDAPSSHPVHVYTTKAADKIKEESNGRLEIQTFPIGSLGGQGTIVSQARLGAIAFVCSGDITVSSVVPVLSITAVPFAFSGFDAAWNALSSDLGRYLRGAVSKAPVNLYPFAESWDGGFRQMVNGVRPIQAPDDLKGLRMRAPPSALEIAMFKALGAAATAVDTSETYVALQTHLVDGLDEPLIAIETNKRYEVSKYVSITNHIWTRYGLFANTAAWASLPKDLQDLVERNFDAAAIQERAEVAQGEAGLEATLKRQGMVFNRPVLPPFKKALQAAGLYAQWRDAFGSEAWGFLEKAVGKLA